MNAWRNASLEPKIVFIPASAYLALMAWAFMPFKGVMIYPVIGLILFLGVSSKMNLSLHIMWVKLIRKIRGPHILGRAWGYSRRFG